MGDTRIVIRLIGTLESNVPVLSSSSSLIVNRGYCCKIENGKLILTVSADSTLRDMIQMMESNLLGSVKKEGEDANTVHVTPKFIFDPMNNNDGCWNVELYDCSLYPPRELTKEVKEFHESSGPKSITLHSLGLFPSAKLVLVHSNDVQAKEHILFSHAQHSDHQDYQYNLPTTSTTTTTTHTIIADKYKPRQNHHSTLMPDTTTTTTTTTTILPSQLLQAVNHVREEELSTIDQQQQQQQRRLQTSHNRRTEKERCQRLDSILDKLRQKDNKNNKNKKVSKKVQQMLIQSRSDGDKKRIHQQDRFYLQIFILDDTHTQQQQQQQLFYYFFSRVATVGKIISTLNNMNKIPACQSNDTSIEFLVSFPNTSSTSTTPYDQKQNKSFYRIPTTMSLYEAETNGYCHNFDSVILRIFSNKHDSMTTSILDYNDKNTIDDYQHIKIDNHPSTNQNISHPQELEMKNHGHIQKSVEQIDSIMTDSLRHIYANMNQAIQTYDTEQSTNHTKKQKKPKQTTTASSEKVRQMLMKSKAIGNKKIEMKDRLYLQVYMLKHNNKDTIIEIILCQPMFFSKWSRLEDIANDPLITKNYYKGEDCKQQVDILVHTKIEQDQDEKECVIFRRPPTNLRLMDIEKRNYIYSFGKIYMRLYSDGMTAIPLDHECET